MNPKELRIIFMGTPEFAAEPLRRLVDEGYNVVAVITSPDKPSGRGLKMTQSAVKSYAAGAGLCLIQPEKLRDENFLCRLAGLKPDLGIVVAFRMLPQAVWSMPRLGTFNLHASLLPQYRGAAPINWAIINGEERTGVTTFMLNDEIDKGDILGREEIPISCDDTAGTLHDKLMKAGSDLIVETIDRIASGCAAPVRQNTAGIELKPAPKIFTADRRIDWCGQAKEVYDFVRGLSPYPAAWSVLAESGCRRTFPPRNIPDENREQTADKNGGCANEKSEDDIPSGQVKIFSCVPEQVPHGYPCGHIVSDNKTSLKIAVRDGFIRITEIQAQGKKRMTVAEFLRGFKDIQNYRFC